MRGARRGGQKDGQTLTVLPKSLLRIRTRGERGKKGGVCTRDCKRSERVEDRLNVDSGCGPVDVEPRRGQGYITSRRAESC